jgi:hypothetical protein
MQWQPGVWYAPKSGWIYNVYRRLSRVTDIYKSKWFPWKFLWERSPRQWMF